MRHFHIVLIVSLAPALALPEHATAEDTVCAARIRQVTLPSTVPYAPFAFNEANAPIEIELEDAHECQPTFVFRSSSGSRLRDMDSALPYQLLDENGRTIEANGVAARPARAFRAQAESKFRARISIPPGHVARAGLYRDNLLFQLRTVDRILDEREIDIRVRVLPQASIAVGGSARGGFSAAHGASLNFGELATGKERRAFLFVQANSAYALQLSSENGGAMRRVGDGAPHSKIAYTASLDGQWIDLSAPVMARGRGNFIAQAPYALSARVGSVEGKPAGEYRDVITVNVVMLE